VAAEEKKKTLMRPFRNRKIVFVRQDTTHQTRTKKRGVRYKCEDKQARKTKRKGEDANFALGSKIPDSSQETIGLTTRRKKG